MAPSNAFRYHLISMCSYTHLFVNLRIRCLLDIMSHVNLSTRYLLEICWNINFNNLSGTSTQWPLKHCWSKYSFAKPTTNMQHSALSNQYLCNLGLMHSNAAWLLLIRLINADRVLNGVLRTWTYLMEMSFSSFVKNQISCGKNSRLGMSKIN